MHTISLLLYTYKIDEIEFKKKKTRVNVYVFILAKVAVVGRGLRKDMGHFWQTLAGL